MTDTVLALGGIIIVILLAFIIGTMRMMYLNKKYKDNANITPEDFE